MPQMAIFYFIRILFPDTDKCHELCLVINDSIMRSKMKLLLLTLIFVSCSKEMQGPDYGINYSYGRHLTHDKIVLGDRLENPYKT